MGSRKIWVKRAGASATLVKVQNEDLVDDVRDMILKKYSNSLGRSFDAPDVVIRIVPRAHPQQHLHEAERLLEPDEPIGKTIDSYYPGGQTVEEALLIEVPRRTPKASPRVANHLQHYYGEIDPTEAGGYFPPMPMMSPSQISLNGNNGVQPHAISVLTTGKIPSLPSPTGRARPNYHHRPRTTRHNTSSPTLIQNGSTTNANGTLLRPRGTRSRGNSDVSDPSKGAPIPPPLPTPPAADSNQIITSTVNAFPSSIGSGIISPRQVTQPKALRKFKKELSGPPGNLPDGSSIPPINCLIVEDNIINLKLLEAFMKRLRVRWATALNGREALTKWRQGGFHLVLMDIQLPVMNGLEATKEIRRLERVNGIGVFSSSVSASTAKERQASDGVGSEDLLGKSELFKSPVIIVALTASSLQSDRHEALAAGCNDFLTKVEFSYSYTYSQANTHLSLSLFPG